MVSALRLCLRHLARAKLPLANAAAFHLPPAAVPTSSLRPFEPRDLSALYHICHATGFNGTDATPHLPDSQLLGHIYAAPYAMLEPELALMAVVDDQVAGYTLATADSGAFHTLSEARWFAPLRARYPLPPAEDVSYPAGLVRALHRGHPPPPPRVDQPFPAHLHIDLLPGAQGLGLGRRLLEQLFALLRARGVPGVHLYVGRANARAARFYEHIGFQRIDETAGAFGYGYRL